MDDNHSEDNNETVNNSLEYDSGWYPAQLWQRLQEFRTEGHLVDVTLCAEGKEIPCHRLVLSACSDYFHAMFSGAHSESKKDKIEIGGVSAEALQLLVDYAYTSKVTVTTDNVQPLYEAANMLQVKPVENGCEKFLTDNLRPETCLGTWALADKVSCQRLFEKAKLYALKHFEDVCSTEEFLELPVDVLKTYISGDGLYAKKEEQVVKVILVWSRHDLRQRQRHLKELLECVRFSQVNPDYLKNITETDKVLAGVSGIKELIKLKDHGQSRHVGPRHIQKEEILVLGGTAPSKYDLDGNLLIHVGDNPDIYRLDLNGDCVNISLVPESVKETAGYAACVVDNDVIVTGGISSGKNAWQYKPSLHSWTELDSLNRERCYHGMAVLREEVYVVGGRRGYHRSSSHPHVEVYCEVIDNWELVAPLKQKVCEFGITTCCEKIYVLGGRINLKENTAVVQCYDPTQDMWTFATPLPHSTRDINACTINSKIYLVVGELAHVLCYSPQENCYEKMTGRLASWHYCSATVCGSEIYITGGYDLPRHDIDDKVPLATVQCYNASSNTMIMVNNLPLPLYCHISVTVPKL
ncbi:kelch-like protein 24 [Branchiostoma lanceolatum]|uniref:kelch-like protein 24 n=1 Tax=Branchiostoma lanceolatum TaxID=7740 RepID=UPI003455BB82